jgi:peptide deformylase
LRIFVVSKRAFTEKAKESEDTTFINPEIITISKDRKLMPEGCLSVRWLYGNARRASRVKVRAQDENGTTFERTGTGLIAQIFQHEIDHLDGILFTDHAKDIKEIPPESLVRNHD